MKEPSKKTSFENRIGKSNINLTLANSNVLRRITDWSFSDEESNSDQSIMSYAMKTTNNHKNNTNTEERKFRVNSGNSECTKKYTQDSREYNLVKEQRKQRGRPGH